MTEVNSSRQLLPDAFAQDGRLPVEVHCHGFNGVDFSDLASFDLDLLNEASRAEDVIALPTLYLHRDRLSDFERLVHTYARRRADGELGHIGGIALEGPLLASHGGTPASTVWLPTPSEWERLAALGEYGLVYTVLSPDAFSPDSGLSGAFGSSEARFDTIIPLLVSHGVRPALGHFTRADPTRSAAQVNAIVELALGTSWPGGGVRVITDHLFNDMPLNIRHAFRTESARAKRAETIAGYDLPSWTLENVEEVVGAVPAAIIRQAHAGRIAACINFDGEHVDLEIAKRAVELMGFENSMLMTDRCDSARLGGQELRHSQANTLWYQQDGIVAAGSQPLARQVGNARSVGLKDAEIWHIITGTAHRAFDLTDSAKFIEAGRQAD
jgi:N-acetylglucosamine-6-phosphate deacetylase